MWGEVRNAGLQGQQSSISGQNAPPAFAEAAEKTKGLSQALQKAEAPLNPLSQREWTKQRYSESDVLRICTRHPHYMHFNEPIPSDVQLAQIEAKFETFKSDRMLQETRYKNSDPNILMGLRGGFREKNDFLEAHVLTFLRSMLVQDQYFAMVFTKDRMTLLIEKEDPKLAEKYPGAQITTKASLLALDAYLSRAEKNFVRAPSNLSVKEQEIWDQVRRTVLIAHWHIGINQTLGETGLVYDSRIEMFTDAEIEKAMKYIVKAGYVKKWELTSPHRNMRVVVERLPEAN